MQNLNHTSQVNVYFQTSRFKTQLKFSKIPGCSEFVQKGHLEMVYSLVGQTDIPYLLPLIKSNHATLGSKNSRFPLPFMVYPITRLFINVWNPFIPANFPHMWYFNQLFNYYSQNITEDSK